MHMLPGELCENLCSLAPDVDRLAFTVEMDIDTKGKVVRSDFYKSVIRSKGKLTYEDVNRLFDGETGLGEIYSVLKNDLYTMRSLREILSEKRSKRGSIDLDLPESEIYIQGGMIEDILLRERGVAERLIEEFMLITNTTVAEYVASTGVACLYRSHEDPDKERLENFRTQMNLMGHSLRLKDEYYSGILNKFLASIQGEDDEFIIRKMLLRCMKKACYSIEETSHFALGYEYYTHFTSPIRRYPDLVVHRVLSKIVSGGMTEEDMAHFASTLGEVAEHTSKRERVAEDAERYCEKLYMAGYMDEYSDEVFEGIISGVIKSGFFVQLGNLIEGFVPLHTMEDDYYDADVLSLKVVGRRHGDVYKIGDTVEVGVDRIDFLTGEVDFYLI
ncbi:MAG: RNB domain-containing ribonuclease [Eubacteriaceae bacterium]|nr:RNB domain-containing ribonuclease [Eubacteriaceae bacterium]